MAIYIELLCYNSSLKICRIIMYRYWGFWDIYSQSFCKTHILFTIMEATQNFSKFLLKTYIFPIHTRKRNLTR